jgi:hypothetical protein
MMAIVIHNVKGVRSRLLSELALNFSNKLLTMTINIVLGVKQRAPSGIPVGLKRFDVFLSFELFLKGWRGCGGASCFPDLSVEFLNLALQPNFQVLGPSIKRIRFRFEESRVPPGDRL